MLGTGIEISSNGVISQIEKSYAKLNIQSNASVSYSTANTWIKAPLDKEEHQGTGALSVDTTNYEITALKECNVLVTYRVQYSSPSTSRKYHTCFYMQSGGSSYQIGDFSLKGTTDQSCSTCQTEVFHLSQGDKLSLGLSSESTGTITLSGWNTYFNVVEI